MIELDAKTLIFLVVVALALIVLLALVFSAFMRNLLKMITMIALIVLCVSFAIAKGVFVRQGFTSYLIFLLSYGLVWGTARSLIRMNKGGEREGNISMGDVSFFSSSKRIFQGKPLQKKFDRDSEAD
jgi:hypothetical protein